MLTYEFEQTVPANHRMEIELPADAPVGQARVIVLFPDAQSPAANAPDLPPQTADLANLFNYLRSIPPTGRSKENIDDQIKLERESWG